jgi:predicted short-subunit dehydrogenase-like oxidoreductase (DUF2520 family)
MKIKEQDYSFYIIGGGRVGAALAHYLIVNGYHLNCLVENNPERYSYLKKKFDWKFLALDFNLENFIKSKQIILAVPDDSIVEVSQNISRNYSLNCCEKMVVHTSGTLSSEVLLNLKKAGAFIGSIHPIYSFSYDPKDNDMLNKVWFSIEGDSPVTNACKRLFCSLGNNFIQVSASEKKAIHLACVFYANFFVALAEMSQKIIQHSGIKQDNFFQFLNPLLLSTVKQISKVGTASGLTGPVKRGDIDIIKKQLYYLKENHPSLVESYVVMSEQLLKLSDIENQKRSKIKNIFYNI